MNISQDMVQLYPIEEKRAHALSKPEEEYLISVHLFTSLLIEIMRYIL